MPPIFIVERHDYQHQDDSVGRKHFLSAHTTLKAANRKAKVQLYRILRDEGADGDIENQSIEKDGTYEGTVNLRQDYTDDSVDYTVVSVFRDELRDASESPFSDSEEEEEFKEAAGGFSSDEEIEEENASKKNEKKVPVPTKSLKTATKHARTSSMTNTDGGAKKKAKVARWV